MATDNYTATIEKTGDAFLVVWYYHDRPESQETAETQEAATQLVEDSGATLRMVVGPIRDENDHFAEWQTGGGCKAYGMVGAAEACIYITDKCGSALPKLGDIAMVGRTDGEGYQCGKVRFTRFDGQTTFDKWAALCGGEVPNTLFGAIDGNRQQ